MSESYCCYLFLSVYHLYAIVAVTSVLVEWHDVIDAIVNVTVNANVNVNAIVIALMAFDVVEVDLKLKHSIGYLNSANSIPNLVSNSVCVTNRYSAMI